ncbi:DUF2189 domain-containing protein [Geminicoccus roseus]|uniref:DUF2189 domain-containing protein n=1 Tax=Geminicoccus roseus TaxID=404900 RepID=UPI00041768C9|nr:DUF2189 domain-containing protein [Geminicoccus roseus]
MAADNHIRNPIEWSSDQLRNVNVAIGRTGHAVHGDDRARNAPLPAVRRIDLADLRDVLNRGIEDFGAYRTDVIFICLIYPLAGLVLAQLAFGYDMLPILFPLASGFALIGPVAAVGLYEMSRRREQGREINWSDAFAVLRAPAFGAILVLGIILFLIFALWLGTAYAIYEGTLGPRAPVSLSAFLQDVFTTGAGWSLIVVGCGVGFLFALLVLTISVVSFPMLLDRDVGLFVAMATSVKSVWTNPVPMAAWGLIVTLGLVLGSLPALLGLVFVMPVLGHATWHLYRKLVPAETDAGS